MFSSEAGETAVWARLVLLPAVVRLDVANGTGAAAHHDGVRARATTDILDAIQQLAGGDAGRGEGDIVRGDEVVDRVDAVEVHALGLEPVALLVGARPDLAEHLAADTLDRRRRQDGLWRAAGAQIDVRRVVVVARGLDRRRHVAIGNQPNARARCAHLVDNVLVAWPVENDNSQVAD